MWIRWWTKHRFTVWHVTTNGHVTRCWLTVSPRRHQLRKELPIETHRCSKCENPRR